MGMDIHVARDGVRLPLRDKPARPLRLADRKVSRAFVMTANRLKRELGSVDGFFYVGGLDLSASHRALGAMLGGLRENVSASELGHLYNRWLSTTGERKQALRRRLGAWDYDTAEAFLGLCIRHNLGFVYE